ncbi:unnamed protein product [Musa acuminata subsp. malaccensis]|uniref:(wild Malaysian banana) hypothetical protein n=1 Tax=Musa acuminata subsp. malaccensis TaxID=214687 RepID=A0A804HX37_MUSAM|nr:unnamed protein product [Musa acuminata subsp. malaccensis]
MWMDNHSCCTSFLWFCGVENFGKWQMNPGIQTSRGWSFMGFLGELKHLNLLLNSVMEQISRSPLIMLQNSVA